MGRYLRRRVALVCALLVAAIAFVALSIHHHAERSAGSDARIEQVARLRFETAGLLMQLSGLVDPPTTESLASLAGAVEAWRLRRDGTTRDLTQLCEPDPRLCDGFDAIDAEAAAFDAAIGTVLGADREAASTAGGIATVLAIGSSFVSRYDDWIHALPGRISNHELQQMRVLLAGLAVTLISILLIAILIAEPAIRRVQRERSALDQSLALRERVAAATAQSERAVLITDLAGRIEWVNEAFGPLFGYPADQIAGRSWTTLLFSTTAADRDELRLESLALDPLNGREVPAHTASGRPVHLRIRVRPFVESDGRHTGYVLTAFDITERKHLHDELAAERDLLEAVVEALPAWVFWKDVDDRYLGCNTAFARQAGLADPTDMAGRATGELDLPETWRSTAQTADLQVIASGHATSSAPYPLATPDGAPRHLVDHRVPLRDAAGRTHGMVGVVTDVTSLVEATQRVADIERRWDLALQGSGVGVWDWAPGQRTLYLSPCWKEMLGFGDHEIESTPESWISLVHPADRAATGEALRGYFHGRAEDLSIEQRLRHRDGTYRWVLVRGRAAARGARGMPTRVVGTTSDITDIKRTQNARATAGKLEAIGQLAAGVAHEINTPSQYVNDNLRFLADAVRDMTAVVAEIRSRLSARDTIAAGEVLQVLQAGDFEYLGAECPKAIEQSIEGIARISTIVRALKELSHPGQEKVPTDVNRVVSSAVTLATNEWKYVAEVDLHLDAELPTITATPSEIQQVVVNLVVNAAHAIEAAPRQGGGRTGLIRISTSHDADAVELRVSDNGCGIPEELQGRIFDAFFTTKPVGKGTGQGLAIVQNIVASHGGYVHVDSTAGRGTTFIVRLPAAGDEPEGGRA